VNGPSTPRIVRFGVFEADLQHGELRKSGIRVRLQTQPFRVLALLLARPGEIITRDEIVQELWGAATFVDFDQSIGAVMRKLRQALGDSAAVPRYIETLRQKGYRFLLPVQTENRPYEAPRRHAVIPAPRQLAAVIGAVSLAFVLSGRVAPSSASAGGERKAPKHLDAYIAYQKGRYLWNMRTSAAVGKSIGYFQQAVALDPEYAPAYAGMAKAYAILNFYTGRSRMDAIERAAAAAQRALRLDHSLAEGHAVHAYISFYYHWDGDAAERGFRQAIALDPNYATARQWYAEYLFYTGRFEEANREIRRAHELDPQSIVIGAQLASPYLYARNYVEAIARIHETLKLSPDFPLAIYMLGTCYEQLGRWDEAVAEYRRIAATRMGLTALAYACARSGRQGEARQILRQLLTDSRQNDISAYHVARIYAGFGDAGRTLAWLNKAREARDERMVMLKVDPKLDTVRSHPLFRELMQSVGLMQL
jgi:DNA-binding winged helix-turn-helix (wHTH) protein/Tfp pilus assembly protein PilF